MKRTLILLAAALCLSLGGLTGIHLWVDSARDQVELTETVLAGDPAAAAGVTVTFRTQDQQGHLTWATAFTPGGEPETDFRFIPGETNDWYYDWTMANLETEFSWGMVGSYAMHSNSSGEYEDLLMRMAADVAEDIEGSGERTETLRLSDYCSTWPVEFQAGWDHIVERYDSETNGFLADYFRIPVDPELEVDVTVKKESRNMTEINTDYGPDAPMIDSYSVVTAEGAYLAVKVTSESGKARLECPEGLGVHFVPFVEDDPDQWFNPRDFRLFYPTEAEPLYLSLSEDGSKLLLYTREEEKVVLTVIDRTTAEALQRLELMDMGGEDDWFYDPVDQGPLHLVRLNTREFRLLQERPDGIAIVLAGSIDSEADFRSGLLSQNHSTVLAWDGERLIWGAPGSYVSICSMSLGVWTAEGMQFLATYQTGQTRDPVNLEQGACYRADAYEPLSIAFG